MSGEPLVIDINRHEWNNRVIPIGMTEMLIGYKYQRVGKDGCLSLPDNNRRLGVK